MLIVDYLFTTTILLLEMEFVMKFVCMNDRKRLYSGVSFV